MKKIYKQFLVIILIILLFIMFDIGFYNLITKRFINKYGYNMQEKSIELKKYLPFDKDSLIVHLNTSFSIKENMPVLDGATALFPVYSSFMESIYPEGSSKFENGDFTSESYLQKRGTTGAYKALVDKKADIIFCAKPSDEQIEYANSNGVEFEMVPIGSEAFVFIVNSNNRIDNLSIEQIKGIYTGKYTNWSELGGDNALISPLQRSNGSGSQTAMLSFMNGENMVSTSNIFLGKSIGYSFRYYINDVVADGNLKILSLNGVYPNEENIRNKSYPIVDNFYAIYRKNDTNENIPQIIEWILSNEGQRIVNETGYIGVN